VCKLVADVDVDVKNGAGLFDRLLKEIVMESEAVDVDRFIPLLRYDAMSLHDARQGFESFAMQFSYGCREPIRSPAAGGVDYRFGLGMSRALPREKRWMDT
jgi:hypothetical protein